MRTQVTLAELGHDPEAVLRRVVLAHEQVLVLAGSQPSAVVISLDDYAFLEQLQAQRSADTRQAKRDWATRARQLRSAILRRAGEPLPDSVAELNELREERADGIANLH